jgi:UDPglucose--hexose-1-phosphate uridylyltransferase
MPELRQNRVTKEWVVIATERAKRPEQLSVKRDVKPLPAYSENCPFCAGNEAQAPPEIAHLDHAGQWQIRVVPNKFSALAREGEPTRKIERSKRTMNGVGIHDVIVEGRQHNLTTALLSEDHVANIFRMYKLRYDEVSRDPRIQQIIIFKNHGGTAGASLEHPHSQLIGIPVISHQVRERFEQALRHYDEYGECIFCQMIKEELEERSRVVIESEHFVAMEQFASPTPFGTHVHPKRHMASFGDINEAELVDLARVMKQLLAKLYYGLENPDFNYSIRTAPAENAGVKYYHWYISVIPRLTKVAGFELGSGMFINVVLPEAAAEFLRNVKVEQQAAAGK